MLSKLSSKATAAPYCQGAASYVCSVSLSVSFETNIIENFYYGNNYTQGDDEYTGFEPCVYSCSSDKLQMEYQVITRIQRFEKKGKQVSSYNSRVNICLY